MKRHSATSIRRNPVARAWRALAVAVLALLAFATGAPPSQAQKGCDWYGSPPFCDGQCPQGHVYTGKRQACTTGSRRFCCPAHYETKGVNCKWVGEPGRMLWVCDEPILKFYVKNGCPVSIAVKIEYRPLNAGYWASQNYRFAPGETGYLVDTKNRYIYVTANEIGGKRVWARHRVDMGEKVGVRHTHAINCN